MTTKEENISDNKTNLSLPSNRKVNAFHQAMSNIFTSEVIGNYKLVQIESKLYYLNRYEQIWYDPELKCKVTKPPAKTEYNIDRGLIRKLKKYSILEIREDFFSLSCVIEIDIEEKISPELFENILQEKIENILFISLPNSGKTYNTIIYLKKKKIKFVYLVPLRSQVIQYQKDHELKSVDKETSEDLIKEYFSQGESIVTVYDQISKVFKAIDYPPDYYLIIDEYHKLVTDSNYRGNAIRSIREVMHRFGRTIGLTATPYGSLDYRDCEKRFKIIKFNSAKKGVRVTNYIIVTGCHKNRFNIIIEKLLLKYPSDSLQVIFRNDIEDLNKLEKFIIEELGEKKEDILIFSSETKEDEIQLKIIETRKVPSNIKFLLCTSAFSTGLNIDVEADNIFIGSESSIVEVYQFINRFRNGVNTVYDLIEGSDPDSQGKKFYKFSEYQARILDSWEMLSEQLNGLKLYREFNVNSLFKSSSEKEYVENEIIERNGFAEPFEEYIIFQGLKSYFKMSIKNQEVRKLFLERYLEENKIIIFNIDTLIDLKPKKNMGKVKDIRQNFSQIVDLIKHYPSQIQFRLNRKNLIDIKQYKNNRFISNFFKNNNSSQPVRELSEVSLEILSEFFGAFKWYLSVGVEKELAIKLINTDKYQGLYYSIKFVYYLSLDDQKKQFHEYKRIGSNLNKHEIKFVQQLNNYLIKQDSVTAQSLKSKFNKISNSVIHDYLKSGYIARLGKIYNLDRIYNNAKSQGEKSGYKFRNIDEVGEILSQFDVKLSNDELKELIRIIKSDS